MGWLPLHLRRQLHLSSYMYRIVNEICPKHFIGKFTYISGGSRGGENCNLYTQKSKSHKEFFYLGAKSWNAIPQKLRTSDSVKNFSNTFKALLLSKVISDSSYRCDNSFNKFYPWTNDHKTTILKYLGHDTKHLHFFHSTPALDAAVPNKNSNAYQQITY